MNIEQLIKEKCPNGVEYKRLSDVCELVQGYAFKSTTFHSDKQDNYMGLVKTTNIQGRTISEDKMEWIDLSDYPQLDVALYTIRKNRIVIGMSGTIKIGINDTDNEYLLNQRVGMFIPDETKLNNAYLNHLLHMFVNDFYSMTDNGPVKNLSAVDLKNFQIPLPPLEIQNEIVNILDKFTEMEAKLEAELEAELEARKSQYEYYRNKLLDFSGEMGVRWMKLRDIISFRNGAGHEKCISENGKYVVVNSKFISTEGGVKKYSDNQISPLYKDEVLLVMSDLPNGKALAKCFIVDEDDKYTLNQRIGALKVNDVDDTLPKYLYYVVNRNRQLLRYDNGNDQTNLRKDDILDIDIPLPPLEEQERIVKILDTFSASINDITEGLPAEIEMRHKQYEYYREKLLTFNEA